jgi:hypothetical protein
VSRTLAFESRLLLLRVFEVDVLEILQELALYSKSGGAGGCAVGFSRRKKLGRAHTTVRGEGGGGWAGRRPRPGGEGGQWLGLGRRRRPKRGGGEWAGGRSHGPGGKRKEAGLKSLLGLKSKEVKEKSI